MVGISRDPFARHDIVRRVVQTHASCTWCGGKRTVGSNTPARRVTLGLYEYGTERDDRPGERNVNWHTGLFCCKSCHDSYHS